MDDERFKKFATDPKFRSVPKKEKKVKIDARFQSMFTDKKFSNKVKVDKRGKPETFTTKETYQKYYRQEKKGKKKGGKDDAAAAASSSDSSDSDDDEEEEEEVAKVKANDKKAAMKSDVDYARGEGVLESSSSEEESSDEEEEGGKKGEGEAEATTEGFDKWGEMDHDAERTEDVSRRLAVCNLDWDRVGAQDIFLVLSSFCPKNESVESVQIYVSEFGKKRLAEEEVLGPEELRKSANDADADLSDEEDRLLEGEVVQDQEEIDRKAMERVRLYQVRRLKYYYAVAAFSSEDAANTVYTECDGNEYELSATRFDLRFIPDEMDFEVEDLKEECLSMPDPGKYKPKVFFNKALMQGKAELTWDEADPRRAEAFRKANENPDADLDDEDLKAFIAGGSSSEEEDDAEDEKAASPPPAFESLVAPASSSEDEEEKVAKYKALLADIRQAEGGSKKAKEDRDNEGNMEMTFADSSKFDEDRKQKEFEKMTPWEQYLHKKSEKRKAKRLQREEERKQDDEDDDDDIPEDLADDPFFKHSDEEDDEEGAKKKAAAALSRKKKRSKENSAASNKNGEEEGGSSKDLSLLVMDSDDDKAHFDYKEIVKTDNLSKKKLKKLKKKQQKNTAEQKEDDFRMDLKDDRFGAMYENADFNVDPSHPNFKKTKSMQAIVEEKQKRIVTGKRSRPQTDADKSGGDSGGDKKAGGAAKKAKTGDLSGKSAAAAEQNGKEKAGGAGSNDDRLQKLMHSVKSKSNYMQAIKSGKKKSKK